MFDRYTGPARRVVYIAEGLAQAAKHPQAGSGHLLLAIMYERECCAAQALASLGLTTSTVHGHLASVLADAGAVPWMHNQPLSPRLHTVLQDASADAIQSGRACVGTEHLLLSAIRDRNLAWEAGGTRGTAIETLLRLSIDPEAVRDRMLAIMDGYDPAPVTTVHIRRREPERAAAEMFTEVLLHLHGIEQKLGIAE